ncbi:hypothetical protein BC829DRAFT_413825 [Chytridium lagenaria]|nr:hypothetical protein BC829DRAFT_413825 [Chytridium lagenaria]
MLSAREMTPKELFGGAITISLPERFVDASQIREVPDNQEVYVDTKGTDQSIIVELLECCHPRPRSLLRQRSLLLRSQHFWVIADENGATASSQVLSLETIGDHPYLKNVAVVTYCLGQQAVSKFRETAAGSENLVDVYLAVFRIPSKETDLLISFNHPISLGEKSSSLAT